MRKIPGVLESRSRGFAVTARLPIAAMLGLAGGVEAEHGEILEGA